MNDRAIETICDCRASRTPCLIVRSKHKVIDEKLRTSFEEIGERRRAFFSFEPVFLVNRNPRQLLPLPRKFIASTCQFFLGFEQLQSGCKPFLMCSGTMH